MALQEEFEKRGNWLFRYRGSLPLVILVAGLGLYLFTKIHPERFSLLGASIPQSYAYICFSVSILGLVVRVLTVGRAARNTSGRNVKGQVADRVNTTGPYSMVRHPLYLGNFLMWLGPAMLTGHIWFILFICLVFWLYYERIMFAEEQYLRKKFGASYLQWAEQVPPFLPSFGTYRRSDLPFNWKKVLKKEKNGIAALFLVFALFDVTGKLVTGDRSFNYVFLAGTGFSALFYITVKILRKKTRLLSERD